MSRFRPLIGITPWYDYDKRLTYIKDGYIEGVAEAGGLPVLLPLIVDEELLDEMVLRFDGFLLSGGGDMDAVHYGECNRPYNGEISPHRDRMEMYIVKRAVELNKPLLGICRGIQVMNVALGGTLYQDIFLQIKDRELIKHSQNAPRWYPTHCISIEKGSTVGTAFGGDSADVNSFHHQAVKDVAPCFKATSWAADGIIESIEHKDDHIFAVGVQWHPELMWRENPVHLRLFEAFVAAAEKKRGRSSEKGDVSSLF